MFKSIPWLPASVPGKGNRLHNNLQYSHSLLLQGHSPDQQHHHMVGHTAPQVLSQTFWISIRSLGDHQVIYVHVDIWEKLSFNKHRLLFHFILYHILPSLTLFHPQSSLWYYDQMYREALSHSVQQSLRSRILPQPVWEGSEAHPALSEPWGDCTYPNPDFWLFKILWVREPS